MRYSTLVIFIIPLDTGSPSAKYRAYSRVHDSSEGLFCLDHSELCNAASKNAEKVADWVNKRFWASLASSCSLSAAGSLG